MKYTSVNPAYVALAFVIIFFSLTSFAFADSRGRGVQSASESRRTETLTRVLTILEENVPEQANSPEVVAEALANPIGNSASSNGAGEAGNNGGTSAGNGGNGGNSSPGGLVKAGGAVSNSTALNAINTVILRISLR